MNFIHSKRRRRKEKKSKENQTPNNAPNKFNAYIIASHNVAQKFWMVMFSEWFPMCAPNCVRSPIKLTNNIHTQEKKNAFHSLPGHITFKWFSKVFLLIILLLSFYCQINVTLKLSHPCANDRGREKICDKCCWRRARQDGQRTIAYQGWETDFFSGVSSTAISSDFFSSFSSFIVLLYSHFFH